MTTQQILNLSQRELEKLTERELKQTVSTLRSTARKRYERIQEANIFSEAAQSLWKSSAGHETIFPTVKDMDTTQLLNEYKRYRGFLVSKTSTVKGARKSQKHKQKTIKEITGVDLDSDSMEKFYNIYEEAKNSSVGGIFNYKTVMETVAEVYDKNPNWNTTKILNTVEKRLQEAYERENAPRAIYPSTLL